MDNPTPARDKARFQRLVMTVMFGAQRTRPDTLLPSSYLASRVSCCTTKDEDDLEHLVRYINGSLELGIRINPSSLQLEASMDASYAIHPDAKGHSGIVISFENNGGMTFVKSSKQKLVGRSSTEDELICLHDGTAQVVWIRRFMKEMGYEQRPTEVEQDNQSTILLANKGEGSHSKTKHINVRYFCVKQLIDDKEIVIKYTPTEDILADFFSKPTYGAAFLDRRARLMH
jgi:hypothetical protein